MDTLAPGMWHTETRASSLTLDDEEIRALTGGYVRADKQLVELHRQGFTRARRSKVTGKIVLERAHYDSVTRGQGASTREPELMP